jgi:predicted SAM-dependent methyltransferase
VQYQTEFKQEKDEKVVKKLSKSCQKNVKVVKKFDSLGHYHCPSQNCQNFSKKCHSLSKKKNLEKKQSDFPQISSKFLCLNAEKYWQQWHKKIS